MSRWAYDIDAPPPQGYEAVDAARDMLRDAGLMTLGGSFLASEEHVYSHEEPVTKPDRYVFCTEMQQLGGKRVDGSGLLTVRVHVKSVTKKASVVRPEVWHAGLQARISRSLTGKPDVRGADGALVKSRIGWPFRQVTEPSRAEYYADTDTYEAFSVYAVTLEPKPSS